MIHDYATGRKMQPPERLLFSGAARGPRAAKVFDRFGSRQIGATQLMAAGIPLALAANLRHAVRQRRGQGGPEPRVGAGAGAEAATEADAGSVRSGARSHV
jgi:hypothetical protein